MMVNSSNRLLISEILQKVHNAKTKREKIILLRQYESVALRQLLIWNYDTTVVSMMPLLVLITPDLSQNIEDSIASVRVEQINCLH